ncbi:MAG: cytochrome c3 family protein, partial [Deltaproteobacteria bacterium]|nr:cytochrome c3 family protein [Deltaproteobacteria bacterium]
MIRRMIFLSALLMIVVPAVLCARWIKDKVYLQTETYGKVEFSHYTHMEMKSVGKNCQSCHNDIFHILSKNNSAVTMQEMEEGKSCGVCHNGVKAFAVTGDCTTCHASDVKIDYGQTSHVVFSHDVHTEMFGCDECHPDLFMAADDNAKVTMAAMQNGESCGACHDGSTAFGVTSECGTCHSNADDVEIASPVGLTPFSHNIHLDMFGCDECHPDIFQPKANSNQVGMKAMENGESCGTCHDGSTAFGVTGDCTTCHSGAVDLEISSDVGAVPFSHDIHLDMFGCSECHPDILKAEANSNQVGMKAMENGESCGACHDGSTAFGVSGDCSSCHPKAIDMTFQT